MMDYTPSLGHLMVNRCLNLSINEAYILSFNFFKHIYFLYAFLLFLVSTRIFIFSSLFIELRHATWPMCGVCTILVLWISLIPQFAHAIAETKLL